MLRSPEADTRTDTDAETETVSEESDGARRGATGWARSAAAAVRSLPSGGAKLGAAAFGIFLLVSVLLWGLGVLPHFGSAYLSRANVNDQRFYEWALAWWPYAIGHGLNPLHTGYLWSPGGVNLTWVTSLAGPALILSPLTLLAGPLVSQNLLFLLAPALAAWAAYLVCMRLTGRFLPSLAGGYLFGFSTYVVGQMQGHLNLVLVFPVPLVLYLVIRRIQGDLRRWTFVALLGGTLVLLFSISTEVFATMTLIGAAVLIVAFAFGGAGVRRSLLGVGIESAAAYAAALALVLPYILTALHEPPSPVKWDVYQVYLGRYSSDLAGAIVPRTFTRIGGMSMVGTTSRFVASPAEDGSYFGIPLLLAVALATVRGRRSRLTWLVFGTFVTAAVLALGPVLHLLGAPSIWLPWSIIARLPTLGVALPSRVVVYAWLAAAILVACWLARRAEPAEPAVAPDGSSGRPRWIRPAARWALVVLAAVSLLPAVAPPARVASPAIFTDGSLSRYVHPGETVLSLPFYTPNSMMLWQVESGFAFRLAGGYVGWRAIPAVDRADRATHGLIRNEPGRTPPWALRAFMLRHHVRVVIVSRYAKGSWQKVLAALQLQPVRLGSILIYRIPPNL
jgi:hypothetical protein